METRSSVPFVIAMVFAASPASGDDYYWNSPTGGSFQEATNWLGPVPPPGAADRAIFDLDATYEVDFDASADNAAALVGAGNVTLDLHGHTYQAALCVGIDCVSAQFGSRGLTIANGTLEGDAIVDDAYLRVAAEGELTSGLLTLGYAFSATLEVLEGGRVVNGPAVLAVNQSSSASALIDGILSQWIVSGDLTIGEDGSAGVGVRNGGYLFTHNATLALDIPTSLGGAQVEVSGVGSTWSNASNLFIGGATTGELRVEDGGRVTTANAFLGLQSELWPITLEGRGSIEVDGAGSLLRAGGAIVLGGYLGAPRSFQPPGDPGGFGRLLISNGGEVAVGEQLLLRNDAPVDLVGGSLDVGSISTSALPNEVSVHEAGFLGGTGSIGGSVHLAGEMDPGGVNGSPGNVDVMEFFLGPPRLLQIEGELTAEDTGSLTFDLAGPAVSGAGDGYDAVEVVRAAQLGGELVVNVSPSIASALGPGDMFTVLTAAAVTGGFANVPSGSTLQEAGGLGSFQVFYGPGSPFGAATVVLTNFELVPEPTQVLEILTGAVVLALARRKRRV